MCCLLLHRFPLFFFPCDSLVANLPQIHYGRDSRLASLWNSRQQTTPVLQSNLKTTKMGTNLVSLLIGTPGNEQPLHCKGNLKTKIGTLESIKVRFPLTLAAKRASSHSHESWAAASRRSRADLGEGEKLLDLRASDCSPQVDECLE